LIFSRNKRKFFVFLIDDVVLPLTRKNISKLNTDLNNLIAEYNNAECQRPHGIKIQANVKPLIAIEKQIRYWNKQDASIFKYKVLRYIAAMTI
jgi:hypothetical protein